MAGARVRSMYITLKMLEKYGPTDGCPKCELYGASHSEECMIIFEDLLVAAGEAFRTAGPEQG